MIRCIIVDDDQVFLELMAHLVSKHAALELVGCFSSAAEALDLCEKEKIDLIFLDIEMPGLSGIDLVRSVAVRPQVIFVTAHEGFAVEAFDYQVTDYLLKPINEKRLQQAISKAIDAHKRLASQQVEQESIYVKHDSKFQRVQCREIMSIDACGDYVEICSRDRKLLILSSLQAMEEMLSSTNFMRLHRKHIVRLESIDSVSGYNVKLVDGRTIPVSRSKKAELVARLRPA